MAKEVIKTVNAPQPIGPYNQAIKVGNQLFVSGQIPIEPTTGVLIVNDIAKETHQVLKNMRAVLAEAGMSMDDVVKCTIFLKDMNDFTAMNEVYGQYFNEKSPAREAVEVARLPKDVSVEISCIAIEV